MERATRRIGMKIVAISVILAGAVGHEHGDHSAENQTSNATTTVAPARLIGEAYIYGTLAVIVVSLLSFAGIIVLPFLKRKKAYNSVMLLFMSLAVGTMASDAILHLIPETLGLHSHGGHDHDHGHGHSDADKPYLGKMVLILGTLYGLYLLEILTHEFSILFKKHSAIHDSSKKANVAKDSKSNVEGQKNVDADVVELGSAHSGPSHGHSHGHSPGHDGKRSPSEDSQQSTVICGLKSVAFMMTASDALHNFTDGLAIGAAFAKGSAAGLAVSIAVVCHELPHEVGDFAILINTGLSVKRALLINFISALTCFAGVYPGIAAGQNESWRQWIFAVVAGGFLYVALVHMLREIKEFGSLPRYLSIVLQNVGLLLGFVIVLLLAVYEDNLSGSS